jgi:hypothetical protein
MKSNDAHLTIITEQILFVYLYNKIVMMMPGIMATQCDDKVQHMRVVLNLPACESANNASLSSATTIFMKNA